MEKEIKERNNNVSLSYFDNVVSELMKTNPDFAKGVEKILNGASYEDAMNETFSEEEVQKVLLENFGEISENALSDTIEDYQVRQLAKDIKEDVSFKLKEAEKKLESLSV